MYLKYLLAISLIVSLSGCAEYTQIFQTSSTLKKDDKNFFTYENDTVKIQYYFWQSEGIVAFSIFNKLDKPLYIDWKKSSYVKDQKKIDYWVDEEEYNSHTYSTYLSGINTTWLGGEVTIATSDTRGKKTKPERITFIAPKSYYSRQSPFILFGEKEMLLPKDSEKQEVDDQLHKGKKVVSYSYSFTKEKSPLVFRNFLSISTSEKFESETYIDNEFYISKITEIKRDQFEVLKEAGYYKPELYYPYKSPDRFFVDIMSENSVKFRTKPRNPLTGY